MERTVIHHADLVLVSGHATAAFCAQRYDYPLAEISVIHSGIDTVRFLPRPQPRDERHPKILFVGRLIEQKGIKELVSAVLKLKARYPKICLRVIGKENRELLTKLEKQIGAADAKTNFEYKGYVPYGELADHYAWCDFFASPSAYEPGPGNLYLEAMACGKPVIACNMGELRRLCVTKRGLLVLPGDVKSLRKAIVKLTEDVELRERLGNNGRAWVEENVSIEKCIGKVERLYEESIAEGIQVT